MTRRKVQVALGVLWLIDGLLQLQHQMFTSNLATQVIAPAAAGQPRFVSGVMHFFIHIFLHQPAFFNGLIVLTQLGIGALLIFRRTVKLGLICSIIWGLFVWYVGEGLGGLFAGGANIIMGAPGAALIYAILSVGVWPAKTDKEKPASWLAYAWMVIWLGGATLELQSGLNTASGLSSMLAGMANGTPVWLGSLYVHAARLVQDGGNLFVIIFIILMALVGILALAPKKVRAFAIWAGIVLSFIFWFVGQSLGGYYTGLATDPNTAPLIILLGLAVLNTAGTYNFLKDEVL